jgi:hypothetical protein
MKDMSSFTDIAIRCGSNQHRAHKVVVCSQSDYFCKAFSEHFEVSKIIEIPGLLNNILKEGRTGEISLPEEPNLVRAVLEYLYNSQYTIALHNPDDKWIGPLTFDIKVIFP